MQFGNHADIQSTISDEYTELTNEGYDEISSVAIPQVGDTTFDGVSIDTLLLEMLNYEIPQGQSVSIDSHLIFPSSNSWSYGVNNVADLFTTVAGGNGSQGNAFNLINTSGNDLYIDGFRQGPAIQNASALNASIASILILMQIILSELQIGLQLLQQLLI